MTVASHSVLLFLLAAALPQAQPSVPDPTLPPPAARPSLTAVGIGVQIYSCTSKGNAFTWVFSEPRADLFDPTTKQPVGTHTKGPTWTWADGSTLTGKPLQQRPDAQPDNNVAWLLLAAQPTTDPGALSSVRYVRRSDTQGGMPTTSTCDAAHAGTLVSVPYRATYTFYTLPAS